MPLPSGQLAILEAKHHGRYGVSLGRSFEDIFEIIEPKADIISILVDPEWNGSLKHLRWARQQTRKPLLAKAMHRTNDAIDEAFGSGADYALAYDFVPRIRPESCLVEPSHLGRLAVLEAKLYVWNNRDLDTDRSKPEGVEESAWKHLGLWWCQASFIQTAGQIHPDANAFLVGTHADQIAKQLPDAPVLAPELWP